MASKIIMQCPSEASRILCSALPEEVWENAALYLSTRDVLVLLSVNRRLYNGLGKSASFWDTLSTRDGESCYDQTTKRMQSQTRQKTGEDDEEDDDNDERWRKAKASYLFRCHKTNPTKSGGGVEWYPVRAYGQFAGISAREGHISCVLSRQVMSHDEVDPSEQPVLSEEERRQAQPQERIAVITGGFSNDDFVYLIHTGTGTDDYTDTVGRHRHPRWEMKQVDPSRGTSFVYGATLTALPTQYTQTTRSEKHTLPPRLSATMRAIRFGGFRAGGYSNETSQVSMLTVKQEGKPIRRRQERRQRQPKDSDGDDSDIDDCDDATWEWQWEWSWEASWSDVATTGMAPDDDDDDDDEDSFNRDFLSRAYHTSTLLLDRYLVVIGGMKSTESVLNEAILDTKTWTWFGNGSITCDSDSSSSSIHSRPSGRHGHSVVLDDTRNRLVLFGGGSGSDLLRSGEDNSEVWELQLGDNWRESDDMFVESFPWKWKKLHDNSNNNNNNDGGGGDTDDNVAGTFSSSKLSPSETLCLGRCHNCIKISRDTVLLLFGSGRPTTNGMVAYDLKTDTFFRHRQSQSSSSSSSATATTSGAVHVTGILPKPRFTGVAAFLEEDGYIITHGGYCGQDQDTIGTMDVLDLAPGFCRPEHQPFVGLAIDDRRVSYEEVTDVQAERGRRDPDAVFQRMLQTLMNTPVDERQAAAGVMLNQMNMGEQPSNGQSLLLMSMIANGHPLLEGDNDDDDDDEYNEADMDDSD